MTDVAEMARRRDNQLRRERSKREAIARANGRYYGLIEAEPIREHLNALADLGWTWSAVAELHGGITNSQVRQMALGTTSKALPRMHRLRRLPLSYAVPATLAPETTVPAAGALRRVESLLALGWTHDLLREHTDGYNTARLLRASKGRPLHISAENWRRVDAVFRLLSTEPGPSERNRARARQLGYAPPAAWDDIDDPTEAPKGVAVA